MSDYNISGDILACVACRRCHSKCDRKLPKCTTCGRKDIDCSYTRVPRKRGPNSENLVSVNAVNRLRDEIRRQKQLQAYYHQQYNEFLSKKAAYDDNQTEISEQTGTFLLNPMLMQNLLRMATKFDTNPLLKNTYLFKELLNQYIVDTFPFYEFRVPYMELDQFNNSANRLQRGLMYTMLANSCCYLGNIKLFGELTQLAKAEVGLNFDTSEPIITAMYFIMADSYVVNGDYEKCALAHSIASTSVKNLMRRTGQEPMFDNINLNLVSKFSGTWVNMVINNEFQVPVETANELLTTWDKSISGASEYFWYMATLREVKIIAEMTLLHLSGFVPSMEMVQTWLALINQASIVLQNTPMPRRSKQVANLWVEATRAFIYLAANQREAALQVCDLLIEDTRDLELKNLMSIAPLAVIASVYLFYLKYDKFNIIMTTLQSLAYSHPVARVIVMILNELSEVYMPLDSISSLVRMMMNLFSKYTMNTRSNSGSTSNEHDNTGSDAHNVASIFTNDNNLPPVPEPSFEHESSPSNEDLTSEHLSSFKEIHENQIWGSHDDYVPQSHGY